MDNEEQENWSFPFNFNIYSGSKPKSRLGLRKSRVELGATHPVTPGRNLEAKQGEVLRDIANIIPESNPILNESFISDSSSSLTGSRQSLLSETFKTPGRSFYIPWSEESPLDPLQGIEDPPEANPSDTYFSSASTVKKNQVHKTLFGKMHDSDRSFGIIKLDERKGQEESVLELTCDSEQAEKHVMHGCEEVSKKNVTGDMMSTSSDQEKFCQRTSPILTTSDRKIYSGFNDPFKTGSSLKPKALITQDHDPINQYKNNVFHTPKPISSFDSSQNALTNFMKTPSVLYDNNNPSQSPAFNKSINGAMDRSTPAGSDMVKSNMVKNELFYNSDNYIKKVDEINLSLEVQKRGSELKHSSSVVINEMPPIPLGWYKNDNVSDILHTPKDYHKSISSVNRSSDLCRSGNRLPANDIHSNPDHSLHATNKRESHTDLVNHLGFPSHSNLRLCKTQDNVPSFFAPRNDIPHSLKPIPGIDKITKNISSLFTNSISKPFSNSSKHLHGALSGDQIVQDKDNSNSLHSEKTSAYPDKIMSSGIESRHTSSLSDVKNSQASTIENCKKIKMNPKGPEVNVPSNKIHHSFPFVKNHVSSSQENIWSTKSKLLQPLESANLQPSAPNSSKSMPKLFHSSGDSNNLASALLASNYSAKSSMPIDQIDGRSRHGSAPVKSIFQASLLKSESSIMEGNEEHPQSNLFHSSIINQQSDNAKHRHHPLPFADKDSFFKRPTHLQNQLKTSGNSVMKSDHSEKTPVTPLSAHRNTENQNGLQQSLSSKPNENEQVLQVKSQDQDVFKKPLNSIMHRSNKQNQNLPDQICVNDSSYHVLSLLGQGGSSKVYQALDDTSRMVAIKCVDLTSVDKTVATGYLNEVHLLSVLQSSDSVIKMHNHEYKEKNRKLYVVMEMGDVDFSSLIKSIPKGKRMPTHTIIYYWIEMLHCVRDIHEKGVIHSDLKPANFLLVKGRLKLIDFGIASSLQDDMTSVVKEVTTGTFNYMSPEAIVNYSNTKTGHKISYKSDIWSLGCILYQLVYGRTPYSHITHTWSKMHAIGDPKCEPTYPSDIDVPFALEGALRWSLTKDPKLRPTTKDLLTLPYFPPIKDTHWGANIKSQLLAHTTQILPAFSSVNMK